MQTNIAQAPAAAGHLPDDAVDQLYRRVRWRLLPLLFISYLFAFLDRVNIGFAQLQMKQAIGVTDAQYGLAAGVFFVGYALFEVPSNFLFGRVGARRTFLRIMVLWGMCSSATLFITAPWQLYVLRFLLGVFEAGFFPGVILYLTYWFPRSRRGSTTGIFLMATVAAGMVGAPLSGAVLQWMDGALGLQGWQWLFLLMGLPTCVLGVFCYCFLDDRPADAHWLDASERAWIDAQIREEEREHQIRAQAIPAASTFGDPQVYLLSFIYFALTAAGYGINFWLPTLIRGAGVANYASIGLLALIPSTLAAISIVLVSWHSDRVRERQWHFLACVGAGALGLALATATTSLSGLVAAIAFANMGATTAIALFWSLPPTYLDARRAPVGIALISTIGTLSGFVLPSLMGAMKVWSGSLAPGILLIVVLLVLAAFLAWRFVARRAFAVGSK
ncbi:MFS transporter [Paraburkholderia sp. J7]|uniref:MFS transporter n=1 Tax=Paraburkholderia sp. J7 TaxID=2805438 RepID=UPI002AB6D757|nr:MFS transporter [Paraburkholderia sp. J7]